MSDLTSVDLEFQHPDDEFEEIDGMEHLQISSPKPQDTSSNSVHSNCASSNIETLVEDYKKAKEDLWLEEKFTKMQEAKTRWTWKRD